MALRELLAQFDIQIDGQDELKSADQAVSENIENLARFQAAHKAVTSETTKSAQAIDVNAESTENAAAEARSLSEAFAETAEGAKNLATGTIEVAKTGYEVADVFLSIRDKGHLLFKVLTTLAISLIGLGFANVARHAWAFVESITASVDEIGKMSTALGIGAESMQRWGHLADTSGASNEDLRSSFKTLASQLQQVKDGAEAATKNFKELGLDGKALAEIPLEDAMIEVTAALGGLDDQGKKLALTQAVLSETALKMLPGFKSNTEEMRAQLEAMDALAGVYSEEFIRAAEATNDELHFMRNQFGVLKSVVIMTFLPSFRAVVKWISDSTASIRKFLKETDVVTRWFKGGTILGLARLVALLATHFATLSGWALRFGRFLAPVIRFIARFAAWALILDDIIVFLQGGESKTRDWLDALFGLGTADTVLQKIYDFFGMIKTAIDLAIEVVGWLWSDFKGLLADVVNGTSTFDNAFGGFGKSIKTAIELAQELWGWVDKLLGVSDAIAGIGEAIFQADDERMNREAITRAQDATRAAGRAPVPRSGNTNSTSVVDNSKVSVTLNGKQTPETVAAATKEAQKLRSNRGAQNALIRGTP